MRKIEIELTDEQYNLLSEKVSRGTQINFDEESNSGFDIKLRCIEGGISWIEFEMQEKTDIGEVNWSIT